MFIVSAMIRAKEDKVAEMANSLTRLCEEVKQESGTMEYRVHQGNEDPCQFFVYEVYQDAEGFDQHTRTDYLHATLLEMEAYAAGPLQVNSYRLLADMASPS